MDIRTTLRPGQKGTRQLLREYGDQLVCVRYRYDKASQKRYKTVELIVEEKDWIPGVLVPAEKMVSVQVAFGEKNLRDAIKDAGGYWDPAIKAWILSYRNVLKLGLERRILDPNVGR